MAGQTQNKPAEPAQQQPAAQNPPPAPQPSAVNDDLDDLDDAELTAAQRSSRALRRYRRESERLRERNTALEQETATLRTENSTLKGQVGSVSALQKSLLTQAIRAHAASLVRPEAMDDVIRLLDTGQLSVGDDGSIDDAKVKAVVEDFVKARPHLAPVASNGATTTQPLPLPGAHGLAPPDQGLTGPNSPINKIIREAAGRG